MYGAVISTLATFILRDVGLYYFSQKLYPIQFEWFRLFLIFSFIVIMYSLSICFTETNVFLRVILHITLWLSFPILFILIGLNKKEKMELVGITKILKDKYVPRIVW